MERDEVDKTNDAGTSNDDSRGAVNSLILDYYKKFGRKRDLEQYFSLSTAQSDIKDTSGLFWRKMKSENDSSDSGGRKSDSSQEVCRISIRCSLPEHTSSQDDEEQKTKTDSPHTESPPIIIEEAPADVSRQTDDESFHFDDNNSQKSLDALLDLSTHKPLSPTSSITSQRKLEWDSLADVGYGNESDRKNSASSLSTLERLALKQQYSNNDSKQEIGIPTSHSTPIDENDNKTKAKKGIGKKTKFYKKDVDFVEVNVPHTSDANPPPSINVNLTKHISFNVERDGGVTIDNIKKDVSVSSPEKVNADTSCTGMDKEIQTTLPLDKPKEKSSSSDAPKPVDPYNQKIPVMISLNTLRKRLRKKKARNVRRKLRTRKQKEVNKDETPQEKSGAQLSEAESFEYMPGHVYNQNKLKDNAPRLDTSAAGNKSSLESSGLTTDSSKGSKHSLTKDLEQCIELLKHTLQKRYDDGDMKRKLIKDIVERLVSSKYRNDYNSDFLSGISSKRLGMKGNNTTTSTSDANNTEDSSNKKPKKSILRSEKFNANVVASTSQSAPNLFSASIEKVTNLVKPVASNTESDVSSKEKTSSENGFPKTSSEELYLKYLEALRREEAYKKHLKDKEMFLKQKLVKSDTSFKVPVRQEAKINSRLKDLMKDLTRNNYDDGSGDASKLEGGSSTNLDIDRLSAIRNQRSHSVFTLSSSQSDAPKRSNLKKKMQAEREMEEAGPSQGHYCCCPHHYLNTKTEFSDSSVQVNIKHCGDDVPVEMPCQSKGKSCFKTSGDGKKSKSDCPKNARVVPDTHTGDIRYVCVCGGKQVSAAEVGDNFMIYRCSKVTNRGIQPEDPSRMNNTGIQCGCCEIKDDSIELLQPPCKMNTCTESSSTDSTSNPRRHSKASQTNMLINMCLGMNNYKSSSSEIKLCGTATKSILGTKKHFVCEATRCLQTEISINPQIADPRLSDINIICNNECARLISEQRRRVSAYSIESEGGKTFSDVSTNSTSDKLLMQPGDSCCKSEITSKQGHEGTESKQSLIGKDYTIPILGTNMTLTVNLGPDLVKKSGPVEAGVVTEKISQADQETLAVGEVSRSAQCCLNPECSKISKTDAVASPKTTCCSKDKSSGVTYNTYPTETVKEKSPFKRSNTDIEKKLSINTCMQTDVIQMRDMETNQGTGMDINYSSVNTCENSSQVGGAQTVNLALTKGPRIGRNTKDNTKTDSNRSPRRKADCCSPNKNTNRSTKSNTNDPKSPSRKADSPRRNKNVSPINKNRDSSGPDSARSNKSGSKSDSGKADCCSSKNKNADSIKTGSSRSNKSESKSDSGKGDCCSRSNENEPKSDSSSGRTDSARRKHIESLNRIEKVNVGVQKDLPSEQMKMKNADVETSDIPTKNASIETENGKDSGSNACCQTEDKEKSSSQEKDRTSAPEKVPMSFDNDLKDRNSPESCCFNVKCPHNFNSNKGPIIDMIQDITRRYSKKDLIKIKKNKCFSEIITVLNYLLETDDSTDPERKTCCSTSTDTKSSSDKEKMSKLSECCSDRMVDKSVQLSCTKSSKVTRVCTDSSDLPCSSDLPTTSSDSAACKVLNKIKKECEKFHQKVKCKGRKCEVSSSTSVNCEKCKKVHHCACRSHKCKRSKAFEKLQKKCIAYNLIIQTSESMLSEETVCENKSRPLKNIILKVPKKGKKEGCYKVEQCSRRTSPVCSPKCSKSRPRSCRHDSETSDEYAKRMEMATVREYLEQNRPDFVKNTSQRQDCLKVVSERRASERAAKRDLLSLHVEKQPDLTKLTSDELRQLAKDIGLDLRKKRTAPKFINEREMKKHSEKIYKTLPEVVQKKEEMKKENIKKTNLLMANIFKKNLQKQALRGSVNLSNYSPVIKI